MVMVSMLERVVEDILQVIGFFLLNPLFAVSLLAAVGIGYFRVKRERRYFRVRQNPGLTELQTLVSESWLYALILSLLIGGAGLVVDVGWIVLFSLVALVPLVSFAYKIGSPVYFVVAGFFGLYFLQQSTTFTYRGWSVEQIDFFGDIAITVPVIAGLLLLAEGMLIRRYAAEQASPLLMKTNRGLHAGTFHVKRLWLLPTLFVIPGDMISAYIPYWPQFTFGEASFSFVIVPVVIGFSQMARGSFPSDLMPKIGQAVVVLGAAVVVVGLSGLWMPILGWTALIIGLIGRIAIAVVTSIRERRGAFAAAPRSTGVVIAGVLPGSPGEKMGLVPGECIRAVNGRRVSNEKELYDALQMNAAHCRLQVIGRDGEVRLAQQVIYRHDHHRLGLLVVK